MVIRERETMLEYTKNGKSGKKKKLDDEEEYDSD